MTDEELLAAARGILDDLQTVWRDMRRTVEIDIKDSGLTVPQVSLLDALAETDGVSLKDLSLQMGLAHSTVSGIVDRLERQGFVHRKPDAQDRRFTKIFLSEQVKSYLGKDLPGRRLRSLAEVLRNGTLEERVRIADGLSILRRLLGTEKPDIVDTRSS